MSNFCTIHIAIFMQYLVHIMSRQLGLQHTLLEIGILRTSPARDNSLNYPHALLKEYIRYPNIKDK